MKIQIDTIAKVIKLESSENLGELVKALAEMLPNDLWKGFKLETNTVITWSNPIIWRDIYVPPVTPYYPTTPWYPNTTPWITWQADKYQLCSGVYNVEI